jgi:hypothetical protein
MKTAKKYIKSDVIIRKVILEWYTNGMFADILQDEYGRDLEEIRKNQNS